MFTANQNLANVATLAIDPQIFCQKFQEFIKQAESLKTQCTEWENDTTIASDAEILALLNNFFDLLTQLGGVEFLQQQIKQMGSALAPELGQRFDDLLDFFAQQQQGVFQGYLLIESEEGFLPAVEKLITLLKDKGLNDQDFLTDLSIYYQVKRQRLEEKISRLFAQFENFTVQKQKKRKREASEDEYDQAEEIVAEIIAREHALLNSLTLLYNKWVKAENKLLLLDNNYRALLTRSKNANLPQQQEQQVSYEKTAENKTAIENVIAQKQQQLSWLRQWQYRSFSFCAITAEITDLVQSIASIRENIGKDRNDKAIFDLLSLLENLNATQQKLNDYFQLINELVRLKPLITQRDEEKLENLSANCKNEIAEYAMETNDCLGKARSVLQQYYLNKDFCVALVNDYAEKIAEAKQNILAVKYSSLSTVEKTVQKLQLLFEVKIDIAKTEFFLARGLDILAETADEQTGILLDERRNKQLAWLQAQKKQLAKDKFYYETTLYGIKSAKIWQNLSNCAEILSKLRKNEYKKLWAEYGEQVLNWVKEPLIKSALQLGSTETTIELLLQDVNSFDNSLVETAEKIEDFICLINQSLKIINLINKIDSVIKGYDNLISNYSFADRLLQSEFTFLHSRKEFWLKELQQAQRCSDSLTQALINKLAENPEKKLPIKQALANNDHGLYWYETLFFNGEVKQRAAQVQELFIDTFLAGGAKEKLMELTNIRNDIKTTHQLHYKKYQNLAKEVTCTEQLAANVAHPGQAQEPVYYRYFKMINVLYQWDVALSNKAKEMAQSYSTIEDETKEINKKIKNILPNPLEYQEFLQSQEGKLLVGLSNSVRQITRYTEILQSKLNEVLASLKKYPQQQELFAYFSQTDIIDQSCKQWCLDEWHKFNQPQEVPSYRYSA